MECYYRSKPKIDRYQQQIHAIWRDKSMFDTRKSIKKETMVTKFKLGEI